MPRLILFRHAKAERTRPGSTDHARALTDSGREDAGAMGAIAARHGPIDLVLSSDAKRAKGTWDAAALSLSYSPEVRSMRSIYTAPDTYLPILNEEGGDAKCVLIVGHNPTMHETALTLAKSLDGNNGVVLRSRFPKAAIAVLDFEGEWSALRPGQAKLTAFNLPERD